jgi:DNA-binding CsgD family transcriptional regulator
MIYTEEDFFMASEPKKFPLWAYCMDEAGTLASNRLTQSFFNRAISFLAQTGRIDRQVWIFIMPRHMSLDKSIRDLCHFHIDVTGWDYHRLLDENGREVYPFYWGLPTTVDLKKYEELKQHGRRELWQGLRDSWEGRRDRQSAVSGNKSRLSESDKDTIRYVSKYQGEISPQQVADDLALSRSAANARIRSLRRKLGDDWVEKVKNGKVEY